MTWHRTVFHVGRSLADGDGVADLPFPLAALGSVLAAAYGSAGPQMGHPLLVERALAKLAPVAGQARRFKPMDSLLWT